MNATINATSTKQARAPAVKTFAAKVFRAPKKFVQNVFFGLALGIGALALQGCSAGSNYAAISTPAPPKETTPTNADPITLNLYSPDPASSAHQERYLLPEKLIKNVKDPQTGEIKQAYVPDPFYGYALVLTDGSVNGSGQLRQDSNTLDLIEPTESNDIASKPFVVGTASSPVPADVLFTLTPDVTGGATADLYIKVTGDSTTNIGTADQPAYQVASDTVQIYLGNPNNDPVLARPAPKPKTASNSSGHVMWGVQSEVRAMAESYFKQLEPYQDQPQQPYPGPKKHKKWLVC